jgi:hypothetical protein
MTELHPRNQTTNFTINERPYPVLRSQLSNAHEAQQPSRLGITDPRCRIHRFRDRVGLSTRRLGGQKILPNGGAKESGSTKL